MAHIVPFRVAAGARRAAEAETGQTESAQIVIFPGVRREHHAETAADSAPKRNCKRDWLELPEELPTARP